MSYGWLTESSLLPKRAKNIEVNKQSLSGLQAILSKRQEARANEPSARRPTKARVSRDEALLVARNEGIDARNVSDEDVRRRKMEEKARKYEELIASAPEGSAPRTRGDPITFDDEDEEDEECGHGYGRRHGYMVESESDDDDNDGQIGFSGKRTVGWGAECSIAQRRKAAAIYDKGDSHTRTDGPTKPRHGSSDDE
eukprot:GEMP01066164.1.p2 GENE.GEMP01066164.1~~GEMP01066164.1.p2  ORF type:complete len:197 (+),score=61.46 GEMP01066164.1:86-676(+)